MVARGMMPGRRHAILLALAAVCCQPAMATPPPIRPESVTVVMADDRFMPDRIEFRVGVHYLLRLENHGKDLHEFTAPAFFATAKVVNRWDLANGGKEVVVQPQETKVIELTPTKVGEFTLICADHDWDGMVGKIIVR
jgi:plastocyanin